MATRRKLIASNDGDNEVVQQSKRSRQIAKPTATGHTEDNSTGVDSKDTQTTRSTRGVTHMDKLVVHRAKGIKKLVEFNEDGVPEGIVASEMQSYIGVLVRNKVDINYSTWRHVPENLKNLIWESVQQTYEIDPNWKVGCMKSANEKWRSYKTFLTQGYIFKHKNNPDKLNKPPQGYYIPPAIWSAFVINRLSEDFQKLSANQQKRRSKNIYPHRLARKGYAGLRRELKNILGDDKDMNRAIMWKHARKNKEGDYEDEDLKEKVNLIDDYIEQKKQGKLKVEGEYDGILSMALKSKEHSDRVRGVGGNLTPTMYFNTIRGKKFGDISMISEQKKELMDAKRKISEQEVRLEILEAEIYKRHGIYLSPEEKESCSIKSKCPVFKPDVLEVEEPLDEVCIVEGVDVVQGAAVGLTLESSNEIVAYGTIVPITGDKLHGSKFPKNCMRVAIDKAVDKLAPLPIPINDEYETLGDVVGNHVAWPKALIVKLNEKAKKKKIIPEVKTRPKDVPRSLHTLFRLCRDSNIAVPLDSEMFGEDYIAYVHTQDITEVYNLMPISAASIVIYMWHLYRKMKEQEKCEKFIFMNPHVLPHCFPGNQSEDEIASKMKKKSQALANRLIGASPNQFVLVPSNIGYHWILTVINPHKKTVYLLDPLGHRIRDLDWKHIVNTALKLFDVEMKRRGKKPTWEIIQGPTQPDNIQCGFYVMRFMREIIEKYGTKNHSSLRSIFTQDEYTRAEIDEVRNEWAECIEDYV